MVSTHITQFQPIAYIHSDFTSKFGIPRQSGLVESVHSQIIFEPAFRNPDALRGLEGYSHIWILWEFSESMEKEWSPTVRPPRLGGNKRMGVFATRSPFRPNPIGLSSVKIVGIELDTPKGPVIHVSGADILDGTPIYDIKPYLPYTDSHPDAVGGFAFKPGEGAVKVNISEEMLAKIPEFFRESTIELLEEDPRPGYQDDPDRIYHMEYAGFEVHFTVKDGILTVTDVTIGTHSTEKDD